MDWAEQSDGYCERTDLTYWSEPINAITNASFLIAALAVFLLLRREGRLDFGLIALLVMLTAIGIGSYLWHTHATRWAVTADVVPILLYVLIYLAMIPGRLFGLRRWWWGALAVVLFIPYAAAVIAVLRPVVGGLNGSIGYLPIPIGLAIFAWLLRERNPAAARGIAIGVGILAVSLTFRTVDEAVCAAFPLGTHLFWHLLNGVMLGWMILVLARHGQRQEAA